MKLSLFNIPKQPSPASPTYWDVPLLRMCLSSTCDANMELFLAQKTTALSEFLPFGHLFTIPWRYLPSYALIPCPAFPHSHYTESVLKFLIWDILHLQIIKCN